MDLIPCGECGVEAQYKEYEDGGYPSIFCPKCGFSIPRDGHSSLIWTWNAANRTYISENGKPLLTMDAKVLRRLIPQYMYECETKDALLLKFVEIRKMAQEIVDRIF